MFQPALRGVGLGWRSEIAPDLLRAPETVDFVEVVAENCAVDPRARREAVAIAELWPVVPHGVKLSLGSAEGIEPERARRLGRLARELRAPALSEHVAFTRAGGHDVGHLTTLPWTREAVRVVARNVAAARRLLPDVPFLLENVAWTFRWPEDAMAEGAFYGEVVRATGCDLLLDIGNLYANALNSGQDPAELLHAHPLERVGMVHVAGGTTVDGFYEDTHAHPVPEPVFTLLEELFRRVGARPVLLERDAGFGPFAELSGEAARLRALGAAAEGRHLRQRSPAPIEHLAGEPSGSLIRRQARLAGILTASTAPDDEAARPFGVRAIGRTRAILLRKRVDEALPLLAHLSPHGTAVRALALRVLETTPRAPRGAGIADAWHVALAAALEPRLAADARVDGLSLRARFCRLGPDGSVVPRRWPFLGWESIPDGTRVWAFKGPGRNAPVRFSALSRTRSRQSPFAARIAAFLSRVTRGAERRTRQCRTLLWPAAPPGPTGGEP